MNVEFRIAEKDDIEAIVNLGKLYCPKEYISHSEIIEDFAAGPLVWNKNWWLRFESFLYTHFDEFPNYIHVVFNKDINKIIGYAILDCDQEYDYSKKYGTVHDVLINPTYAGKGIGKQFFLYIENLFKEWQCKFILFESGASNHNAHHFFEKIDYQVISKVFYKEISF